MFNYSLLLALVAFPTALTSPLPSSPALMRRMDPAVADKSIFWKQAGPSCLDLRQELQDSGLMAALCAVVKLNPNWLYQQVNGGQPIQNAGSLDEVRIKMWRDDQTDASKWLEPILVETEQTVRFDEAMAMKSVDGLGWWDVGTAHNGAKSTETGWWPAAYEKAMLQVGFPEKTADGEYAVMANHRGLQALTGIPVVSYDVDWEGTPDDEKQSKEDAFWSVIQTADYTPVLMETERQGSNLAGGYVYTVMTSRQSGDDRYVTLFMAWYTEVKEYKLSDILSEMDRVTFLKDFPALMM